MPFANIEDSRAYHARYRLKNKELVKAYKAKYVEANPDAREQACRAYESTPKSKARKAEYRERSREKLRADAREYARSNREKHAESLARYRAAKLLATPSWASSEKMVRFYVDARRLTNQLGIKHHVDHIVPLVSPNVCGLHVEHNLQVLTATENQKKGNRQWPDM